MRSGSAFALLYSTAVQRRGCGRKGVGYPDKVTTTIKSVGVLSPGDMGSGVGMVLHQHGLRVLTCLAGRGAASRERAKEAGRPRNQRKAPAKLVEGGLVQGWNAAYGALSLSFPGRLDPRM